MGTCIPVSWRHWRAPSDSSSREACPERAFVLRRAQDERRSKGSGRTEGRVTIVKMCSSHPRHWSPLAFLLALILAAVATASAQTTGALTANGAANVDIRPEVAAFDSAWNILRTNYVAESNSHVDWDALRAELRPRAEAARSVDEVRGVIRQMLERVGQSHFALLPAAVASDINGPSLNPGEVGSLGFNVGPVGGRLVVTGVDAKGPARAAGVKPGWVLTRVGNRDVNSAIGTLSDGASDHLKDFRLWALGTSLLRGRSGEGTELGFLDDRDATITRQIVRTPEAGVPVKFGHLPTLFARLDARQVDRGGASIGVIAFNVWMTAISRPFDEAVDRLRGA